jgi:hypothetical protein
MDIEGSFQCSKYSTVYVYPEPDESSLRFLPHAFHVKVKKLTKLEQK